MNFNDLESHMLSKGISTLAEIARNLDTTPQAVSNWKARNQIPFHIVAKINKEPPFSKAISGSLNNPTINLKNMDNNVVLLSDILLTIAQQLKLIFLVVFIFVFTTFTYVQFLKAPNYISSATILVPKSSAGGMNGLSGFASQFGVNVPMGAGIDLSSPSLFPELIKSRSFAEKILNKRFFTEKFGKELSLLQILTYGDGSPSFEEDALITQSISALSMIISFEEDATSLFSSLKVETFEPMLAKQLAEIALLELEDLNRSYKSITVNEKINFISNRIKSVDDELRLSEQKLKEFNEANRQISSPALQLDLDRLTREVEVQKGIYLTLKQQFELAKIEEIQETSILEVLDKPQLPLGASNKNLKLSVMLSVFFGLIVGVLLGFIRSYLDNSNVDERRKLRKVKNFIKKKSKEIIFDKRISFIVTSMLIMGLPFYLGYESKNPVYFNRYSTSLMVLNSAYVAFLIINIILFIKIFFKKEN
jgi:uncharacterized protein involved in exopolysaccharide biosynthesis